MQNPFLTSNFSRKCNGYTYSSNDRFCGNYFGYASQLPVYSPSSISCCACCANANLSIYKVPVTPVYLCGLRQSTLIQYAPCKRVIFNGLDRVVSRFSGWDVDRRSNFEKVCNFREKSVGRSRKGWGKGRYRCMVYEESGEDLGFEGGIDDEAEVMLSLLTEEVGEECSSVRRRNGRRHKKVIVEERGYGTSADQCVTCGSKKNVGSGISRNRLKFEYESAVNKDEFDRTEERKEEGSKALLRRGNHMVSGRREDKFELLRGRLNKNEIDRTEERREEENKALLRRGHQRVGSARREDKDELLRESREKDREGTLIENYTQSAEEYKEDLSRREEHKQRLRKDGSSCASYYSLSSMGEYESNSGVQENQDEFEEGLTSKYKRNSGNLEEIEIDGKAERHGYQEEQRLVLKKGKKVEGDDLWQKESEKKLTDTSTVDARFRKKSDVHDDVSMKASYKKYEGQEEKATSVVKFNEGRREQRRLTSDEDRQETETIKNYKQFKEHSEGYTQSSNNQKLDLRKTSSSGLISGTTQNNQEKNSSTVLSSVHDTKEKHYHHGRFSTQIDSRKTSRQSIEEVDIQRTISQRQSEHNIQKQKESSVYDSYHESIKNIQTNEGFGKSSSKITMEEITNSGRNDDQRNRKKYDTVVTPPSSQRVPRGALHAGSTSGLVIEEVGHDDSHEDFEHETIEGSTRDETYGQQLGYISHEDALNSADLLQKSSSYHVGEFMDKARHEMSSSKTQKEKETHETKTKHDPKKYEQQASDEVVSGALQLKEQHSSPSSGSKGPSAEMWDVDEPSNQEHPGAEVPDRNSADSVITKKPGRSLWNVMSDIVRFTWASRSTNQSQMSKSGGKNSPNQSTSSEPWFSGNEPDENIQEGDRNRKGSISQESISVKIPKEEKSLARSQGGSSSSSSSKDQIQPVEGKSLSHAEVPSRAASSGSNVPSFGEGTSNQKSEVIVSGAARKSGSSPSPAMRLRRSPYIVGESSASGKVDSSGGGEIVQTELPVSTVVSEGKDENQKSRKLLRTTQVVKDRFEEWEEAYTIEAEQRKTDEMFMREALVEARKAADSWEVPVGAVLVHDGKIIARGHNLVEELRDSTAHAEMICIREASKILRTWRLSETTLYVTLEPCAMCAGAILQARVDVIVWGAPNKLLGADGSWIRLFPNGEGENSMNPSDKAAAPVHPFHPNIEIRRNVLSSECADSMQQFFQRRRKQEKKQEPPRARIPILNQSSKLLSKMHDAFHMMFCL